MLWIIIVLALTALAACARLFFLRRELARITRDLSEADDGASNRRLRLKTGDGRIGELAALINSLMDRHRDDRLRALRMELELREAITGVSHDLRTPLTSILGYLQLLKKCGAGSGEGMEYLRIAELRAKSLQKLINGLFELSAVSSQDYELSLGPIGLDDILLETLTSFYDSFSEKGITPEIEMPEEKVTVTGNAQAVRRVIENLVSNALRHSGGDIGVKLELREDAAVISIRNRAGNLTPDDAGLIFNRFYSSDKSGGEHTGLGLPIAKTLMHKMGGEIAAEISGGYLYIRCEWRVQNTGVE